MINQHPSKFGTIGPVSMAWSGFTPGLAVLPALAAITLRALWNRRA